MLLPRLGALLFAAKYAHALQNASPFFLLSTDPLPSDAPLKSSQLALGKDVLQNVAETLKGCEQRTFYFLSQEFVTAKDLQQGMPKLQKRISEAGKDTLVEIPEVVPADYMEDQLHKKISFACTDQGKKSVPGPSQNKKEYDYAGEPLPTLPSEPKARAKAAAEADDLIDSYIKKMLEKKEPAVLIFLTTPPSASQLKNQHSDVYEMDEPYPEILHTQLKRDVHSHSRRDDDDSRDKLPLFEKYQFFTPPIFMGLSVAIMLLLILYVGISAIAGLDVSYMAFSKEMGPQNQKPKQQ